jgi:hypothetical protein
LYSLVIGYYTSGPYQYRHEKVSSLNNERDFSDSVPGGLSYYRTTETTTGRVLSLNAWVNGVGHISTSSSPDGSSQIVFTEYDAKGRMNRWPKFSINKDTRGILTVRERKRVYPEEVHVRGLTAQDRDSVLSIVRARKRGSAVRLRSTAHSGR